MSDTPTTAPRPESVTMAAKVTGEGPINLTTAEANALRGMVRQLLGQVTELQGLNTMMALGLYRQRLQVIHHEHEDGTVSFDLQPAPPDPADVTPETIN